MGVLEDTRNRTLHGILRVQSCFRGHQARCIVKELRTGIATLQSCMSLWACIFAFIYLVNPSDTRSVLMQLSVLRKLEKSMQSYCRGIEQLYPFRSLSKQGFPVKNSNNYIMHQHKYNQVNHLFYRMTKLITSVKLSNFFSISRIMKSSS